MRVSVQLQTITCTGFLLKGEWYFPENTFPHRYFQEQIFLGVIFREYIYTYIFGMQFQQSTFILSLVFPILLHTIFAGANLV